MKCIDFFLISLLYHEKLKKIWPDCRYWTSGYCPPFFALETFCKDKWRVIIWLERLQMTPLASRMNTNMEIGSTLHPAVTRLCLRHDGWVNNNILLSDQKCHHQQIKVGMVCGKSHSRTIVLLQWKIGFMRAVYQKVNSHRPCVILKTWGKERHGSIRDKSLPFLWGFIIKAI